MEFTLEEGQNLSADCPSLLLPGLSIGNVGQLAVDLLISSTGAKRVGFLDDPSLLPCVGNDAYGPEPEGVLALPLEGNFLAPSFIFLPFKSSPFMLSARCLWKCIMHCPPYESPPHALTLIQQRSPVIKLMSCFPFLVPAFVTFIDIGLPFSDMQVYYVSSTNNDGTDSDCERLGFKRLEEYDPTQRRWKYLNELAEGKPDREDELSFEDELVHDDYYPGLPFAALFSCCKVLH
ncbi:hypothetical protein B296_00010346 [Ensete ventricosum]|uniref:Proteasome assembly chaperone 2 n=1 Tax=Ensete ventricosum TaxID=4639 RepID=A0A426ZWH9_ENSVE|nr:hypothetical protein B296_00010346 [Ensete ventricosum]